MNILIDNKYYKYNKEKYTILQYCILKGINIPYFCYNEELSIAGNCRMCLVEVNNNMLASCCTKLSDNMTIYTYNRRIRIARESILEFLLVNHPLDCPICDQGGECDLQDITLNYGSDKGRFYNILKRSVINLNNFNPLIKTIMTRCIHCTRCVRYSNEIVGDYNFGLIKRGSEMSINTYTNDNYLYNEFIGNIIDLCPVGALTSYTYAYNSRIWKLKMTRSIDILDSIGSSIRIDIFNNKILRILPSLDNSINIEWITNRTRFSYDSLNILRLNNPKILFNKKFIILSWPQTTYMYLLNLYKFRFCNIQIIIGPFFDLKSSIYLKSYFNSLGCSNINYYDNSCSNNIIDFRFLYLLNKTINTIDLLQNFIFIGTNLRIELPLLDKKIRKIKNKNKNINLFSFGLSLDYITIPIYNIGNNIKSIINFIEGKFNFNFIIYYTDYYNINLFNIYKIKKLYFFIGMSILNRIDSKQIIFKFIKLLNKFKYYNFEFLNLLPRFLGRITSFENNLIPNKYSKILKNKLKEIAINHLCSVDLDISKIYNINNKDINIYQGFFNNYILFKYIWLILPIFLYTECYLGYYNLEGRFRLTKKAISSINNSNKILNDKDIFHFFYIAKNKIINNNFSIIGNFWKYIYIFHNNEIKYNYISYVKTTKVLWKLYKNINIKFLNLYNTFKWIKSILKKTALCLFILDPITRNSRIMNICSNRVKYKNFSNFYNNIQLTNKF